MTTMTLPTPQPISRRISPVESLGHTLTLAWRSLVSVKHNPFELLDLSVQPIMFVLLFTYVFGGAISGSPGEYLQFALPGIVVQTVSVRHPDHGCRAQHRPDQGRVRPAAVVADRALDPAGRADPRRHYQAGVGDHAAVRRRHDHRIPVPWQRARGGLGAYVLLLTLSIAVSWTAVLIGVMVDTPEKVQIFGFVVVFPLTFCSNAFVPCPQCRDGCRPGSR